MADACWCGKSCFHCHRRTRVRRKLIGVFGSVELRRRPKTPPSSARLSSPAKPANPGVHASVVSLILLPRCAHVPTLFHTRTHRRVFVVVLLAMCLRRVLHVCADQKAVAATTIVWKDTVTLGTDDAPRRTANLYAEDAVLWGTVSEEVRETPEQIYDYFVSIFRPESIFGI